MRGELVELRGLCAVLNDEREPEGVDVRAIIARFSEQLVSHFAVEETDGYFGTLVKDCPHLAPRVGALRAEHDEMTRAARVLAKLAEHEGGRRLLAHRFSDLLDKFDAHERAENWLIHEFLLPSEK